MPILLIEDERRIASFLSRALSARGFAVDTVPDGRRGLELAKTGRYDLVVLDLLLPGLDGFSVLGMVKEAQPDQRVLVLSALSEVTEKVRCFELGASDYMTKPFSLAELLARVRVRLVEPPSRVDQRVIRGGGISVDVRSRIAEGQNGRVALSKHEFLLFEHLALQQSETCTREELLESVWGYSFDPGTNIVDVAVGRLRRKLGSDVIETIRNVGYRLQAI